MRLWGHRGETHGSQCAFAPDFLLPFQLTAALADASSNEVGSRTLNVLGREWKVNLEWCE